jgi:hypothetical protein
MQELMKTPDALPSLFKGIEIKRLAKIGITAMDLYGVLIAGHLLLPNKEDGCDETGGDPRRINYEFLKLSSQRHQIERGQQVTQFRYSTKVREDISKISPIAHAAVYCYPP